MWRVCIAKRDGKPMMPAMSAARNRATAADLVVLAAALHLDEQRPAAEVRLRDTRLGAELIAPAENRTARILAWLERVCRADAAVRRWYERATASFQACGLVAAVLGLLCGGLAALGAFYYEGSGRVNVIAVLVVLVGIPALFVLLFLVAALPRRWIAWVPGATALSVLARGISPGRIGRLALRFAPAEIRDAIAGWRARSEHHQKLHARVQKWLVLRWAQVFAVSFQCGALAIAFGLVLFTDLVFGWSTTLASGDPTRDATRVHDLTTVLAAPWGWALEDAVPSVDLIRDSRYYRIVDETVSAERASRLGAWWPFLVLCLAVYGLVPRVVLLALAGRRLATAVEHAMIVTPGVSTLLRRLDAAHVQTRAADAGETGVGAPFDAARGDAAGSGERPGPARGVGAVVHWAEAPATEAALDAFFGGGVPRFTAGGAASLVDDQRVVEQVADRARAGDASDVAILVKAWEPPLLEFVDFVQALRRALGEGTGIIVYPIGGDAAGGLQAGSASQVEVWRKRLGRVGDPWLRVADVTAEAGARR